MAISIDDVRRLLNAEEPDAVLVLVEGRTEVVPAGAVDSPQYRGALQVASRSELIERTGGAQPSGHELAEFAAKLDTLVAELGA
ncbi:MAG: pyridine nucleotide-disulfide oxidoreductase [Mycobacterium sp.]|jgi:hypothetical protein|nr:pyridine nucleotide-disulfide oxidoreductase [Mycobacterium sp.]